MDIRLLCKNIRLAVEKPNISTEKLIRSTIHIKTIVEYLHMVEKNSEDAELVKLICSLLNNKSFLKHIQRVYLKWFGSSILEIIVNRKSSTYFIEELLFSFNDGLNFTNKEFIIEEPKMNNQYLYKLMDRLHKLGDYNCQFLMLKTIFRLYPIAEILKGAKILFSTELRAYLVQINEFNFHTDSRIFLNALNCQYKSVFSIKSSEVIVGDLNVAPVTIDESAEFWIDFNKLSRSITFLCNPSALYGAPASQHDTFYQESITVDYDNVETINYSRIYETNLPKSINTVILFHLIEPCLPVPSNIENSAKELKFIFLNTKELIHLIDRILPDVFPEIFHKKFLPTCTPCRQMRVAESRRADNPLELDESPQRGRRIASSIENLDRQSIATANDHQRITNGREIPPYYQQRIALSNETSPQRNFQVSDRGSRFVFSKNTITLQNQNNYCQSLNLQSNSIDQIYWKNKSVVAALQQNLKSNDPEEDTLIQESPQVHKNSDIVEKPIDTCRPALIENRTPTIQVKRFHVFELQGVQATETASNRQQFECIDLTEDDEIPNYENITVINEQRVPDLNSFKNKDHIQSSKVLAKCNSKDPEGHNLVNENATVISQDLIDFCHQLRLLKKGEHKSYWRNRTAVTALEQSPQLNGSQEDIFNRKSQFLEVDKGSNIVEKLKDKSPTENRTLIHDERLDSFDVQRLQATKTVTNTEQCEYIDLSKDEGIPNNENIIVINSQSPPDLNLIENVDRIESPQVEDNSKDPDGHNLFNENATLIIQDGIDFCHNLKSLKKEEHKSYWRSRTAAVALERSPKLNDSEQDIFNEETQPIEVAEEKPKDKSPIGYQTLVVRVERLNVSDMQRLQAIKPVINKEPCEYVDLTVRDDMEMDITNLNASVCNKDRNESLQLSDSESLSDVEGHYVLKDNTIVLQNLSDQCQDLNSNNEQDNIVWKDRIGATGNSNLEVQDSDENTFSEEERVKTTNKIKVLENIKLNKNIPIEQIQQFFNNNKEEQLQKSSKGLCSSVQDAQEKSLVTKRKSEQFDKLRLKCKKTLGAREEKMAETEVKTSKKDKPVRPKHVKCPKKRKLYNLSDTSHLERTFDLMELEKSKTEVQESKFNVESPKDYNKATSKSRILFSKLHPIMPNVQDKHSNSEKAALTVCYEDAQEESPEKIKKGTLPKLKLGKANVEQKKRSSTKATKSNKRNAIEESAFDVIEAVDDRNSSTDDDRREVSEEKQKNMERCDRNLFYHINGLLKWADVSEDEYLEFMKEIHPDPKLDKPSFQQKKRSSTETTNYLLYHLKGLLQCPIELQSTLDVPEDESIKSMKKIHNDLSMLDEPRVQQKKGSSAATTESNKKGTIEKSAFDVIKKAGERCSSIENDQTERSDNDYLLYHFQKLLKCSIELQSLDVLRDESI